MGRLIYCLEEGISLLFSLNKNCCWKLRSTILFLSYDLPTKLMAQFVFLKQLHGTRTHKRTSVNLQSVKYREYVKREQDPICCLVGEW